MEEYESPVMEIIELENEVKNSIDNMTDVTFDLEKLEYISSAGLRVLLSVQKIMNKRTILWPLMLVLFIISVSYLVKGTFSPFLYFNF